MLARSPRLGTITTVTGRAHAQVRLGALSGSPARWVAGRAISRKVGWAKTRRAWGARNRRHDQPDPMSGAGSRGGLGTFRSGSSGPNRRLDRRLPENQTGLARLERAAGRRLPARGGVAPAGFTPGSCSGRRRNSWTPGTPRRSKPRRGWTAAPPRSGRVDPGRRLRPERHRTGSAGSPGAPTTTADRVSAPRGTPAGPRWSGPSRSTPRQQGQRGRLEQVADFVFSPGLAHR